GISRVLNISPDDPRFVAAVNEALHMLIIRMKAFGTVIRYQVCVINGCITFPRRIASIEAISVCNSPIIIRNGWFEFLETGPGLQGDGEGSCNTGCGGLQLFDRGTACTFADILGVNKKIKVYTHVAEAVDSMILIQGYDENFNWVRTLVSGVWTDGEYVSISTTPVTSVNFFSSITGIQKPITNGFVRLYEYDTTLLTQRAIAIYEPDEINPSYRRSLIPGLSHVSGGACETKTVTCQVKLDFVPVRVDTDWLIPSNIPAIKNMIQSIAKAENNLFQEAAAWEARALRELNMELNHYNSSGAVVPVRLPSRYIYGAAVQNLV